MKRYQRILVCVGGVEQDGHLLDYVSTISRAARAEQLHLLHVTDRSVPILGEAVDEQAESTNGITSNDLESLAADRFQGHGGEQIFANIVEGAPLIEILRYGLDNEVDLLVMGRSSQVQEHVQEAVLVNRVVRKATCSVLVVPQDAPARIERILVPVRNSECSANALEVACKIGVATGADVSCLNVFAVGAGYGGLTLEEYTSRLQVWAEKECEDLLDRISPSGVKVATHCRPDHYGHPVQLMLDQGQEEKSDLFVIGARGRTGAAGVLLGKVTEHLIRHSPIPVLAVKKKGECIGILQALLSLA